MTGTRGTSELAREQTLAEILKDLRQENTSSDEAALLRRAAIPRFFDQETFERILNTDSRSISFKQFVARNDVKRAHLQGTYCLTQLSSRAAFEQWRAEPESLRRFAGRLVKHFQKRRDAQNTFVCRLYGDPKAAVREFQKTYAEADREFDYAKLDDLVSILRDRQPLDKRLTKALNDRERYYQSRVLYSQDWIRSSNYLERPRLLNTFESFFKSTEQWLLHLHAPGGSGKTAFLQWLISRYLVVERGRERRRIPVGRVDIDHIDLAVVRRWPWLLLIPIVQQLNQQLAFAPFERLLSRFKPIEAIVRRTAIPRRDPIAGDSKDLQDSVASIAATLEKQVFDLFAEALGNTQCLIVLDTVEELMLHQPDKFQFLLDRFSEIRSQCSGLHLLISGRYPLAELGSFVELARRLRKQMISLPVEPFTVAESAAYLKDLRGLTSAPQISKIQKHARGNPFKLSLFADLAKTKEGLREEDFLHPEIAYLLRRVIERIPEEEMALRWTLRYAIVPQDLTPDFFDAVLKPILEREIARHASALDLTDSGIPKGYRNPWKYVVDGKVDRAALWSALRKYAGPKLWVTFSGDIPRLQPEVVVPMRWLLKEQGVFAELHNLAIEYFENLARDSPQQWALWMSKAVYHAFQIGAECGLKHWKNLIQTAGDLSARQTLAESVLTGDFLDDRGMPLVDPRSSKPVLDVETLTAARIEVASSSVRLAQGAAAGVAREYIEGASRQLTLLRQLRKGNKLILTEQGRIAFIRASVAAHQGDSAAVVSLSNRFLRIEPYSPYAVPLLPLKAQHVQSSPVKASRLFRRAISVAEKTGDSLLSINEIRGREARMWFDAGKLRTADDICKAALEGSTASAGALWEFRLQIARATGSTEQVENLLRSVPIELRSDPLIRLGHNAYVQLDRGEAPYWLSENRKVDLDSSNDGQTETAIWIARALSELQRSEQAFEVLEDVSLRVRTARPDLAERLSLETARIAIEDFGARRLGRASLQIKEVRNENLLQLRMLELQAAFRPHRAYLWEEFKKATFRTLPPLEKATALAHWIAFGRPSKKDWTDFLGLCREIEPPEARITLLRPFLFGRMIGRRHFKAGTVFPHPPRDHDFFTRSERLITFWSAIGERSYASDLLRALSHSHRESRNLIRTVRLVRISRRAGADPSNRLVDQTSSLAASESKEHPELAAIATLELAYWLFMKRRYEEASKIFADASEYAKSANFKFDGRSEFKSKQLRKLARPTARRPIAKLPTFRTERSDIYTLGIEGNPKDKFIVTLRTPDSRLLRGPTFELESLSRPEPSPLRSFLDGEFSHFARQQRLHDLLLTMDPDLAEIPWETYVSGQGIGLIYRGGPQPRDIARAWLQSNINLLLSRTKAAEWMDHASDEDRFLEAAKVLGLDSPDWTSPGAKRALRSRVRTKPQVLIAQEEYEVQRQQLRGAASVGIDLRQVFSAAQKQMSLHFAKNFEDFRSFLGVPPDFIWLSGYFEPSGSQITMVLQRTSKTPFTTTPHSLALLMRKMERAVPPVIFLDVPDDPNRLSQCSLRNQFADALYRLGIARSVLAGGFGRPRELDSYFFDLEECMRRAASEGELTSILARYCELPPALLTTDPSIPIL